jgi:general stress protein 26
MSNDIQRFRELVRDLEVAMLTTRRSDGQLVSRPMATQALADGADLWFVTSIDSPKIDEIRAHPLVNLGYYKDRTREWISVSGKARIVTDRSKIRELHRPDWKAWFPDEDGNDGGPDDPRIVLIGIDIVEAHYLEVNRPQAVVLFQVAKGMITGKLPDLPDVKTIRGDVSEERAR